VNSFHVSTSEIDAAAGTLPELRFSSGDCNNSSTSGPSNNSSGYYDATEHRGRRRPPMQRTMAEDWHADERRRRILSATSRDLARNFAIAAWAIRKHLDFVADFTFQGKTPDEGFNAYLQAWWKEKCKRRAFDVAGRHPHRRATRLAEACRSLDGQVGWLKLAPSNPDNPWRGRIQAIEADRIFMPRGAMPENAKVEEWFGGTRIDTRTGRALAYAISRRVNRSNRELERIVSADNMLVHAAYEFRYDQVNGISPIAAAINQFRDTQESIDYAYAKLKLGELFGVQILTEATESTLGAEYTDDEDGDGVNDAKPRVDLAQRGPFVFELDPGEKAEILESKTPSTETVNFLKLMIHVALRSLDIPYSFFDESFTNFYGSRGGLIQYLHSCSSKVEDLQEFLDDHTAWRLQLAVDDGELELPSGKDLSFVAWEHVPGGIPWWNPVVEARAAAMTVAGGFSSPQRICREIGTNFEENIREIAAAQKFAKELGVDLVYADSTAFAPEITVGASDHAS
jgi:capsid protein